MWLNFVADMTDVAHECTEKNVKNNTHISELIEIRKVERGESAFLFKNLMMVSQRRIKAIWI